MWFKLNQVGLSASFFFKVAYEDKQQSPRLKKSVKTSAVPLIAT